ncbi:MAG: hypothetical protein PUE04_01850 [Lachnospira sp.]|nr:hypothetical protein [Lachnospira sp.]
MEGIGLEEMMDIMQDAAAFRAAQDYVRQTMIQSGYLDTRAICAALRLNCSELKQENERRKNSDD